METIVALGVIMTGLVSVISLTISNLNAERDAATRYQAINFAREGIELVRTMRDSNWISGSDAWKGIPRGGNIILQFNPADGSAIAEKKSEWKEATRIMQCSSGQFAQNIQSCATATIFSRVLNIAVLDCGNSILNFTSPQCLEMKKTDDIALRVVVTVDWQTSGGGQREITLEEILYDWR